MKRTLLSLGLILTLLTTFACQRGGTGNGSNTGNDTGSIKVGIYADLSGQTSGLGQSMKNGVELAKDEINQAGGIGGRQIELAVEDDKGQQDQAAAAVGKLIAESRVQAVLGGVGSADSLAAAQKAQEARVPMITTSSKDPRVTQAGDYIFRIGILDSFQGEVMAKYAANILKVKSAAILSEANSDYSSGLSQSFEENFSKLGGRVVQKQYYAATDQDFKSQLTAISSAAPDVIYIPGHSAQIGSIAKQIKELNIKAPLLGTDGWNDPQVFQTGGAALDGTYITSNYSVDDPTLAVRKFTSDYKMRYSNPPDAQAALAYDAMKVLADALNRAGTSDAPKLRDAIAKTANFPGITGSITIDAGRNAVRPAVIYKLQNGKAFPVYREEAQPSSTPAATENAPGFVMRLVLW